MPALDPNRRICVIGFQKTGTTSVAKALSALGFSVGNAISRIAKECRPDYLDEDIPKVALSVLERNDAAEDSPYAFLFREVDAAFPQTKFILTTRDPAPWLESYRAYFPDQNNMLRQWMYGVDRLSGNETHYLSVFKRQQADIRAYFFDKPGRFLEMDLARGDGWHELLTFLGPNHLPPFPHQNRRRHL